VGERGIPMTLENRSRCGDFFCILGTMKPKSTVRLFVPIALEGVGQTFSPSPPSWHYLHRVMRLGINDTLTVFDGINGAWCAGITEVRKAEGVLTLQTQETPQPPSPAPLHYWFAPLKNARLDYMVQKATEMGATHLCPIATDYGQVHHLKDDRMRSNAIEAAEQCGGLVIPHIEPMQSLAACLSAWPANHPFVFCDESAHSGVSPLAALHAALAQGLPIAVLIGAEGGFSENERALIRAHQGCVPISLGPRILRADTAAVAALALVQTIRNT
jgi:16S rRNA (uracil1498-N3)-methyltransferase